MYAHKDRAEDWWPAIAHPRTLPFHDVSLDSDKLTVSHTIEALDEEILALRQLTSAISARRNRLAGIHKLPAELLERCFWWLSLMNPPEATVQKPPGWSLVEPTWISYSELPRQRHIGWIKVTHVCRHWRAISVNDSTLWNAPSSDLGYHWDVEMSSRAQCVPLIISHTIAIYEDLRYAEQMFPMRIPHTKDLFIRTTKELMGEVLESAFSLSAPLLSRLDLCELGYDEEPLPDPELVETLEVEHDACIPPIVFGHNRLEHLRLQGIPLPRALTSFSNLASLSLTESVRFDGDEELDLSPSDIHSILQGLPKLRELLLHRCFSIHTYPTPVGIKSVSLNELVTLDIEDRSHAVRDLLVGLVLPPSSSVFLHMWIKNENLHLEDEHPITSIFGGPLAGHSLSATNICTVMIDPDFPSRGAYSAAKITAWPVNLLLHGPLDISSITYRPYMSLSWNCHHTSIDPPRSVLPQLLAKWDTSHVQALILRRGSLSHSSGFVFPDAFPNVQQFHLDDLDLCLLGPPPYHDALRTVLLGRDAEGALGHAPVVFQKLASISLRCTDLTLLWEPNLLLWRRELLCLLRDRRSRQDHPTSLNSLHFVAYETVVDVSFAEELREIVPVVRWDP
ncbi:uncharacterized protein STEHIDRAFT_138989 [Stereum hirsutum FP-91666 SS1]|uniref:uncharacterized protein n=1 Tax=Stereum hirsutum (strain FP-91666) TaxID=721885 RepID=UPI000440C448|nr:uncharacterized protein STEHIDRAFT_138989 [Stereum hirsutum FP-91666 SS1]EIM87196.1 hypothetical protein STEHIDRAFT_138989 [Stereum hirsutum FP-91666 SS1]